MESKEIIPIEPEPGDETAINLAAFAILKELVDAKLISGSLDNVRKRYKITVE